MQKSVLSSDTMPLMYVEIPLCKRSAPTLIALVDEEDAERIACHRWSYQGKKPEDFYASRTYWDRDRKKPTTVLLHREILGLSRGDGLYTDHRNGNRLDNRKTNLRVVTQSQNLQNRTRPHNDRKTSKYRGVYWYKRVGKWLARCQVDGKVYCIGYFSDEDEAGAAAAAFRRENMPYSEADQ